MHWQFGEMEFGEMKRNTSNWSNFCIILSRTGLSASAGLSCSTTLLWYNSAEQCKKYTQTNHLAHYVSYDDAVCKSIFTYLHISAQKFRMCH